MSGPRPGNLFVADDPAAGRQYGLVFGRPLWIVFSFSCRWTRLSCVGGSILLPCNITYVTKYVHPPGDFLMHANAQRLTECCSPLSETPHPGSVSYTHLRAHE